MDEAPQNKNLIFGRNVLAEALRADRPIDTLLVARGERSGSIGKIMADCRNKNITIKEVDIKKLDFICAKQNHQGVAAYIAEHEYFTVEDILAFAKEKDEAPFVIVCDEIEDPHNLGAIIRTAECAGAHGVVIPKRRSASLTFSVSKTAAGALEYVKVAKVTNIAATLDKLKEQGLWIYGADMQGEDFRKCNFSGGTALVIGSEGGGLSRLVKEKCDVLVSLPMKGNIKSLNASVAAGILMYQISASNEK